MIFIGAGNVAWHLAKAFHEKGITIQQVYSRTGDAAKSLAIKVDADYTNDIQQVNETADVVVFAVTDHILNSLVEGLPRTNAILLHTSASIGIDVFSGRTEEYGVLYPFQTFTRGRDIDIRHIPLCLETNSKDALDKLIRIAGLLSDNIRFLNFEQRKWLHISGVFACNFANHMYRLAEIILKKQALPFDLLHPLIRETAEKALGIGPRLAQTGPAVRNNRNILDEHLKLLDDFPEIKLLYDEISGNITKLSGDHA